MGNLFAPLLNHLLLSLVVFAVLFIVLCALLARSRFGGMVGGLLRVIASYFYSPFIYLRKAVQGLADYSQEGERRFARSDQYLLHKLLLMLSGALLLGAVGILTVGGVASFHHAKGWVGLHKQVGQVTTRIGSERAEKARLVVFVGALDDQWQNRREGLINAYQNTRVQTADSLDRANQQLALRIDQAVAADAAAAALFQDLVRYLQGNMESAEWLYSRVRDQATNAIGNLGTSDANKQLMNRYTENWYQARMTRMDPRQLGDYELRRVLQPAHRDSAQRSEALDQIIPQDEAQRAQLRSEARSEGRNVFWQPLRAFLRFLVFVWIGGIVIEAIALAVLTATNIQKLRERADSGQEAPPGL